MRKKIQQILKNVGMKKNLDKIRKILDENKIYLRRKYGVKEIGVFGSYARGEQGKDSDIDILVEFSKPIGFFKFLELEEYLEKLLGVKVDLVSKKALKPRIGECIMREVVFV